MAEKIKISARFFNNVCDDTRFVREEVFMKEQGFENEFDELDSRSIHVGIYCGDEIAATGRLIVDSEKGTFTIGRVAVLPQFRHLHLGTEVMRQLEQKAKSMGAVTVQLSAQCRVRPFYEKNGYTASGEVYLDEHCEHIHMEKAIQ